MAKKFTCSICGKIFRNQSQLTNHIRIAHPIPPPEPPLPPPEPPPPIPTGKGQVDIFVDSKFYGPLATEINRLSQDIIADTGYAVRILTGVQFTPTLLRNILIDDFTYAGLKGAILIGDIPFMNIYWTTLYPYPPGPPVTFGPYPSDFYYRKLSWGDWFIEETPDSLKVTSCASSTHMDIWTGRLKPIGIDLNQRISLLKKYLDRNHAYRAGTLSFDKKILYSEGIFQDIDKTAEIQDFVTKVGEYSWLRPDAVEYAYNPDPIIARTAILAAMQRSHEIHAHNGHGGLLIGGDQYINEQDVLAHPPQALFTELRSCATARRINLPTNDDFAGYWLFSGNSLLVMAATSEVFTSSHVVSSFAYLKPISMGLSFGDMWLASTNILTGILLGDPTLKLRSIPTTGAKMSKTEININLGDITWLSVIPSVTLGIATLSNVGIAPLLLQGSWGSGTSWPFELRPIPANMNTDIIVQAGETLTFSVYPSQLTRISCENPIGGPPSVGEYRRQCGFYTNDPAKPILLVNVTARII